MKVKIAQIETIIFDNRKKLNQIVGGWCGRDVGALTNLASDSILQACVQKVDGAIHKLESPTQAGPEYTLSVIETATNNATEFTTLFLPYLGGEVGGGHAEVIKSANKLAQSLSDVLIHVKGITRFVSDNASEKLVSVARNAGGVSLRPFLRLQSCELDLLQFPQRKDVVVRSNAEVGDALRQLSDSVGSFVPGGGKAGAPNTDDDLGDLVEWEMKGAARAIEEATERLRLLKSRPPDSFRHETVDIRIHDSILDAVMAITDAFEGFVNVAADSQQETVAEDEGFGTTQQFCKTYNWWIEVSFLLCDLWRSRLSCSSRMPTV